MKKQWKWVLSLLAASGLGAAEIVVDGKLDEAAWKTVPVQSGFSRLKNYYHGDGIVKANTEFCVLPRKDRIYIGVKCYEPLMEKLKKKTPAGMWYTDGLEIFLCPSGMSTDIYQFLVTCTNVRFTMFYGESGNIKPDPYDPEWNSAVFSGEDFWSCEIELPLSALYMTRQNLWSTAWLVNIARNRHVESERSSWSQLDRNYMEPASFRKLPGFPMLPASDDVFISSAWSKISGITGGQPEGELTMTVSIPEANAYEFNGKEFNLKSGKNTLTVPYLYEKSGRNRVPLALRRLADGKVFKRYYPVLAVYEPMKIHFTAPEYRNNFYPGQDCSKISGTVELTGTKPVTLTLTGPGLTASSTVLQKNEQDFTFDSSGLQYGTAELKAEMDGMVKVWKIQRLPPVKNKTSWISGGCLVVDGKPVLRRHMYAEYYRGGEAFQKRYDADNLHQTKMWSTRILLEVLVPELGNGEALNDIRPCDKLFDKISQVIEENRDKEFFYYYISDEPECRGVSPVYLKHIYDFVAEKDPYHVILMASRDCRTYIDCADWFETHPYINPCLNTAGEREYSREINTIGSYVDAISELNRPDKCIGFLPTIFCYKYISPEAQYPNFNEIVCHTWAAMIHGAKSIWPYAYHDLGDRPALYEGTRFIFSSFEALEKIVLHGKRTFLLKNRDCEAVLFEYKNDRMFAVVNFTQKPITASLAGLSGEFVEFRGPRTFTKFEFALTPHEVIVGTSRKMDAGLPSFADVSKQIDQLEYARSHRGNLLFERQEEMAFSSSKPAWRGDYKLFDGAIDVLAWEQAWGDNKFYEIAFPKFIPEFSKIRVYGKNLDGTTVKIRKLGEWLTLKPVKTDTGEYLLAYDFGQTFKTVKLRLEFPKNKIELYEIELLK